MTGFSTAQLITYGVTALVLALVLWRNSASVRLNARRLWMGPAFVTLFIGMGLAFNPHPALGAATVGLLALAVALGAAFGWWRATATRLTTDDSGQVWMRSSPAALVAILLVFALRQAGRHYLGADGDPAHMTGNALILFDAFMLFALGMVWANRLTLLRRSRALTPPASAR